MYGIIHIRNNHLIPGKFKTKIIDTKAEIDEPKREKDLVRP